MALSRVKTWTAETLFASDLNGEFDNILNYLNGGVVALTTLNISGNTALTGTLGVTGATTLGVVSVGGALNWVAAGGTGSAITATYSPAFTVLTDGMLLGFRAPAYNPITTPTFSPNGLTAHTITKVGGVALGIGDINSALSECLVRYNLASTRWELLNPAGAANAQTTNAIATLSSSDATRAFARLQKTTGIAQSTTTDIFRFLDADAATVLGTFFVSGLFCVNIVDEATGVNNSTFLFSIGSTGNGLTTIGFSTENSVARGTALVTSHSIASDGVDGAIKLQLNTAASGKVVTARASFIGIVL